MCVSVVTLGSREVVSFDLTAADPREGLCLLGPLLLEKEREKRSKRECGQHYIVTSEGLDNCG